ncbi:TIGR02569 family protein [Corynebacterium sp. ES2775-CONJ]|uniref:TIGR02569 family protein n=1 Tax=Corynebacterium sp. ES2775-CONJ TaxID=2974029 RepID=UPI00216A0C44|nr:TIGR02569 family protein [Corynebacterium sp. ES2775-CONJ]MCS4489464.1 TIGR02569 family protein [Corynebacterium sp. ES2775-CONJ]
MADNSTDRPDDITNKSVIDSAVTDSEQAAACCDKSEDNVVFLPKIKPQEDAAVSDNPVAGPETEDEVPGYICSVFQAPSGIAPEPMGLAWDYGLKIGTTIFARVAYPERAVWSSRIRENLRVPGLRIVRPIRSSDGRFISKGWRASQWVDGEPTDRIDETVAAALRLDHILATVPRGETFSAPNARDLYSLADHAVTRGQDLIQLDPSQPRHREAIALLAELRPLLSDILDMDGNKVAIQVTHADMLATTIYSGSQAPVITDIIGMLRPAGYTAAQVMVDALILNATDPRIFDRYRHVPHLDQLLLRALLYRIYIYALHSDSAEETGTNLARVCSVLHDRCERSKAYENTSHT